MERTDLLNTYITDMAAVETHIVSAVDRQLENDETSTYPDAVSVLSRLKATMQGHVSALETYNETTNDGEVKEAVKEAIGTALGVVAGVWNKVRGTDEVSRAIRDAYTATSLATISYHMLYTTALGLKSDEVADLALRHLRDLTPLISEMSEVVCTVVASELANEGKVIDSTVAAEAIRATQDAWAMEAV
ncbi:MAG: hypothetical protein Rubg2KO_33930 [Rubricoccaceae bacterium]